MNHYSKAFVLKIIGCLRKRMFLALRRSKSLVEHKSTKMYSCRRYDTLFRTYGAETSCISFYLPGFNLYEVESLSQRH